MIAPPGKGAGLVGYAGLSVVHDADRGGEPAPRPVFSYPVHHMRGIALLPIVAGHCYNSLNWQADGVGQHIGFIWVELNILFIFISGYLFQHLSGRYRYGAYLGTKARTIVLPYLIISIPALAVYLFALKPHPFIQEQLSQMNSIEELAFLVCTGAHMGPYWFVPMMVLIYLISPLLILIDRRPSAYVLIAPLYILSVTVLPRPMYDMNPPLAVGHYLPVYLLGMAVSHHAGVLLPWLRANWPAMAAIAVAMIVLVVGCAYLEIQPPRIMVSTIFCLAVLALALRFADRPVPALDLLARYSFGIFLVHGYYVAVIRGLAARHPEIWQGSLALFLLCTVVVLLVSVVTVWLFRLVFGKRSRLIVGA